MAQYSKSDLEEFELILKQNQMVIEITSDSYGPLSSLLKFGLGESLFAKRLRDLLAEVGFLLVWFVIE